MKSTVRYEVDHGPELVFDQGFPAFAVLACNDEQELRDLVELSATDSHQAWRLERSLEWCYPSDENALCPDCSLN